MKIPLTGLFIAIHLCSLSQVVPDEFGTVKPEYLAMKSYDADNQAEALVLYDFGRTFFVDTDYGFRIIFERTTKIKVLTRAGIDFGSVEIPYYTENNEMERVYNIDGYTFNFDNGSLMRTRLDPKSTFDEKVNDHWMVRKFAMPDVKEGSVFEYKYKIESPYFVNLCDWEFQSKIPTVYSEYSVSMIPFYEYSYIFQGAKKFDVFRNTQSSMKRNFGGVEYADNIYTFGMKNIPAFRDEAFITSINDYIMKMDFQLAVVHHLNGANVDYITSWPLLNEKLLKEVGFGLYMKNAAKNAKEMLATLNLVSESPLEKASTVFNYVKANFNWDGYASKYAGKTLKEFLRTKTGNTAEINLFLCSMLKEAGLDVYPVILSTRSHGKIPVDLPFQQFLNYVVVVLNCDGKQYLLDGTEPLAPFGMLPARCINDNGLIVTKDKTEWVPLTDEVNSYEVDSVTLRLSENLDSINFIASVTSGGHCALDLRRTYTSNEEDFQKDLVSGEMKMKTPVIVDRTTEIEKPFVYKYGCVMPLETVNDKILINPFPGLVPETNPLRVNFRNYPVDMIYPETNTFNAVIEIPKDYKFAEVVKDVSIDNTLVNISYTTRSSSDRLTIDGSYSFKKAIYLPHEYFELKDMFTTIVETFNKKIILQKAE
ncbi:MAG TPA: DUF3857 domain-containing protein [Bacteroidales bacterium]|jgi:hypothetical protein|nr:DUF3857 domain-containing protein [Bacteroidales bacterium]